MWRHTKPAPERDARERLAVSVADYVETHKRYAELSKREVAIATVRCLTDDIGGAQSFLDAIGVPWDLYDNAPTGVLAVEVERGQAITQAAIAWYESQSRRSAERLCDAVDAYRVGVGDTPQPTTDAT